MNIIVVKGDFLGVAVRKFLKIYLSHSAMLGTQPINSVLLPW